MLSPPAATPRGARLGAFASPAFALAALGLPVVVVLPPLYAELGISLTVVGTIFMVARFFDVVTDPLFGVLGDRVRTPWGRRRPAIVVGVPVLLVGAAGLFLPPDPPSEFVLVASLLVLYLGWTLLTLSRTRPGRRNSRTTTTSGRTSWARCSSAVSRARSWSS